MVLNREERKTLNETCLWCPDDKRAVYMGVIVNESASGLLLHTNEPLEMDTELYLLTPCFGEPFTPNNLSVKQLIQYPVTRKGKVVRIASPAEYGIQFEEENKPAEFRRWYRERSSILTFLTKQMAVIVLEGDLNLETSTLLQSLVNKFKRQVNEFVYSLEQVTSFAGASATILKSIIKSCGSDNKTATIIYGGGYDKAKSLAKDVLGESIFGFQTSELYHAKSIPFPKVNETNPDVSNPSSQNPNSDPFDLDVRFIILSSKVMNQKKYSAIINDREGHVIAVSHMHEVLNKVLEYNHHFVIVDIEIEEVNLLLMLNQLIAKNLDHFPEIIVLGPKHIDEIVKAALKLPVHTYLTKPVSDREFQSMIEHIMHEKNKHAV